MKLLSVSIILYKKNMIISLPSVRTRYYYNIYIYILLMNHNDVTSQENALGLS